MDTLVVDPFRSVLSELTGCDQTELARIKNPAAWSLFELDRLDEHGYARSFYRPEVDRRLDPLRLRQAMFAGYGWIAGMEAVIAALSARWPLHILSNYNRPWYAHLRHQFSLDRFVCGHHVSFELGVRKPDEQFYRLALARINVAPSELLFIDDRVENTAAAARLGIQAITFEGATALTRALESA